MKRSLVVAQITLLLGWAGNLSAQTDSSKKEGAGLSLAFTAGWDFATLRFEDLTIPSPEGDNSDPGYQVGIAVERPLPFNNNKWSVLVQAAYQASAGSNPDRHHQSVEFPLGIRHYFFLKRADLFLDGLLVPDVPIRYEATTAASLPEAKFTNGMSLCVALGGGVRVKRFSLEGRYYFQRSYTFVYIAQYSKMSVILGYRLTK